MFITLVAAYADDRVLGKDNTLLWRLPDDMARFTKMTSGQGKAVVVGRKTFMSVPEKYRPLKNRMNIVITRDKSWSYPGVHVAHSFEDAIHIAHAAHHRDIYVIGGGEIYNLALPLADKLEITRVRASLLGDTFFPEFDDREWRLENEEPHGKDEKHKYQFVFRTYVRKHTGL